MGSICILYALRDRALLHTFFFKETLAKACLLTQPTEIWYYVLADMAFTFGLTWGTTLSNVFKDFTRERQSGLLLHYWP